MGLVCGGGKLLASSSSLSPIYETIKQTRNKKCVCFLLLGLVLQSQQIMGLSTFPSAAEGVLPAIVMNTVLSVTILKNMVRSVLQVVGADYWHESSDFEQDPSGLPQENVRERRVSITQYKSLCHHGSGSGGGGGGGGSSSCSSKSSGNWATTVECCVCLCKFEAEEEVSELSCKHFFHKGCLDKWFDNKRSTCPLCRSID